MAKMDAQQLSALLSAYLDGELDAARTQDVERILRDNAGARRLLSELEKTVEAVSSLPRHAAPRSISEDIVLQLERSDLLGDATESRTVSPGRRSPVGAILLMAAMLGLVVTCGVLFMREGDTKAPGFREDVVASADQPSRNEDWPENPSIRGSGATTEARGLEPTAATRDAALPKRRRLMKDRDDLRVQTHVEDPIAGTAKDRGEPVGGDPSPAPADRLAFADIGEKLAIGVEVDSLRSHRFENETIRLRVTLPDAGRLNEVAASLVSHLAGCDVVDLADREPGSAQSVTQRFYYQGVEGVNYDSDGHQFLVRVPSSELGVLLRQVSSEVEDEADVEFAAGPLVFRGVGEVRRTLNRLGGSGRAESIKTEHVDSSADRKGHDVGHAGGSSDRGMPPGDELFANLLAALGMEPTDVPAITAWESATPGEVGERAAELRDSAEPASLVDRRLKQLEKSKKRPAASKRRARPLTKRIRKTRELESTTRADLDGSHAASFAERYVTLVIELRVGDLSPPGMAGSTKLGNGKSSKTKLKASKRPQPKKADHPVHN